MERRDTAVAVRGQEADDKLKHLSTYLAGGFAVVSAILGFIGVTTGALERILRNQPAEAQIWFLLVGLGIACGLVASVLSEGRLGGSFLAVILLGETLALVALIWIRSPVLVTLRTADKGWSVSAGAAVGILLLVAVAYVLRIALAPIYRVYSPWLLPIVAAVGTVVLLGLAANGTDRFDLHLRQVLFTASLLCLTLGVRALGMLTLSFRELVVATGFVTFFVGLGGMVQLGANSKATKDRPRVTASLSESDAGLVLEGNVKASGLTNTEHVFVLVEGLNNTEDLDPLHVGLNRSPTEKSEQNDYTQVLLVFRLGPDEDGRVDLPVKVNLAHGLYDRVRLTAYLTPSPQVDRARRPVEDAERKAAAPGASKEDRQRAKDLAAEYEKQAEHRCAEAFSDRACVYVVVPRGTGRPRISGTWSAAGVVDVKASAASMGADDLMAIAVWDPGAAQGRFYEASVAPDSLGRSELAASIPVPTGAASVCVVAKVLRAPTIPPSPFKGPGTAPRSPPEKKGLEPHGPCPVADYSVVFVLLTRPTAAQ